MEDSVTVKSDGGAGSTAHAAMDPRETHMRARWAMRVIDSSKTAMTTRTEAVGERMMKANTCDQQARGHA